MSRRLYGRLIIPSRSCVVRPESLHPKQGRRSASSFHLHKHCKKFEVLPRAKQSKFLKRETLLTRCICAPQTMRVSVLDIPYALSHLSSTLFILSSTRR